ncbi:MAG: DinB family protein [Aliishimia sp.]
MITAEYVRTMARYNAWQNKQLSGIVDVMSEGELREDRGAFFGSIFGTLNHLLWGDTLWMSRFDPSVQVPKQTITQTTDLMPTIAVWGAERFRMDGKIRHWAESLRNLDLNGDLSWNSGATGKHETQPVTLCIVHFLNHQTHHRGQVHAMLTAAGKKAPVSDLVFMPEG